MTTRRELIEAVAERYRAAARQEKKEILDEFVKVSGFHRKHAIRALRKALKQEPPQPRGSASAVHAGQQLVFERERKEGDDCSRTAC